MNIAIASDHAAVELKAELAQWLRAEGHLVEDLGPTTADRVDYPDYGYKLATAVASGADPACRCALVGEPLSAALSREHNDANVLAMGARLTGVDMAKACVTAFLTTEFGGGRHAGRVDKLSQPAL